MRVMSIDQSNSQENEGPLPSFLDPKGHEGAPGGPWGPDAKRQVWGRAEHGLGRPARIIPVLDLMAGQVVRAVRGDRAQYRPIESALSQAGEVTAMNPKSTTDDVMAAVGSLAPLVIARALLQRSGSHELYVADLDAIQGRAAQSELISALLDDLATLATAAPPVALWLDAGFADEAGAHDLLGRLGAHASRVSPVFGSETLADAAALEALAQHPRAILSLDGRHGAPLDRAGCGSRPDLWPNTVIMMTLDRVGSNEGPDLAAFAALRQQAPRARWIGAGGIRHRQDLVDAAAAGADAWLVASALHDGRLSRAAAQ